MTPETMEETIQGIPKETPEAIDRGIPEIKEVHRAKALELVRKVKDEFRSLGIDVPFYIAGGSIFSIFTNTHAKDIDVFFYAEEDLEAVVEAVDRVFEERKKNVSKVPWGSSHGIVSLEDEPHKTENAVSITKDSDTIQFIRKSVGPPDEVMKKFDLSCSMVGIDSSGQFLAGDRFSLTLEVQLPNFSSSTFQRFKRYALHKGAHATRTEAERMAWYVCSIADQELPTSYDSNGRMKSTGILNEILVPVNSSNPQDFHQIIQQDLFPYTERQNLVYEGLHEFFSGEDRIEVLKQTVNLDHWAIYPELSPEFVVSKKENGGLPWKNIGTSKDQLGSVEKAKMLYPEYFL